MSEGRGSVVVYTTDPCGYCHRAKALLEAAWELGPREPEILYDLACVRALQGDTAGALARLREAIELGYRDWEHLERDLDLVSVRKAPEYAALLRAHGR